MYVHAPVQYRVTLQGVVPCSGLPCSDCNTLNRAYILDGNGYCGYYLALPYTCNWVAHLWNMGFNRNPDGTLRMYVWLEPGPKWEADVLHCWENQYVLTGGGNCYPGGYPYTSCQFPTTITVQPIGMHTVTGSECIRGETCPKPSNVAATAAESPELLGGLGCGCGCDSRDRFGFGPEPGFVSAVAARTARGTERG